MSILSLTSVRTNITSSQSFQIYPVSHLSSVSQPLRGQSKLQTGFKSKIFQTHNKNIRKCNNSPTLDVYTVDMFGINLPSPNIFLISHVLISGFFPFLLFQISLHAGNLHVYRKMIIIKSQTFSNRTLRNQTAFYSLSTKCCCSASAQYPHDSKPKQQTQREGMSVTEGCLFDRLNQHSEI